MNRYQKMSDKELIKLGKFYVKNRIFGTVRKEIVNELANRVMFKKISIKDLN